MIDLNLITEELEPFLQKGKNIKPPKKSGGFGKIFVIITIILILGTAAVGFFWGKDYVMEIIRSDQQPFFIGTTDTLTLPNPDQLHKEEQLTERYGPDLSQKETRADFVETEIAQPDFEKKRDANVEQKKLVTIERERAVRNNVSQPAIPVPLPAPTAKAGATVSTANYIASENRIVPQLLSFAAQKSDELVFEVISISNPISMNATFENVTHARSFEFFLKNNGITSQSSVHGGNYQIHALTSYKDGSDLKLKDASQSEEIISLVEGIIGSSQVQIIGGRTPLQTKGDHKVARLVLVGSQFTVSAAAKLANDIVSVYEGAGISRVTISRRGSLHNMRMDVSIYFK